MKFKLLLFSFFFLSIFAKGQEPYTNLIFSEVRIDAAHHSYMELCNMGDVAVDLAQFEIGKIAAWEQPYTPGEGSSMRLPARMLSPGETYVIASVRDWGNEQALIDVEAGGSNTKNDTWGLADLQMHHSESPGGNDPTDSISPGIGVMVVWNGDYCWYIRHHYMEGDSVVTDAVNGIFTGDDGTRPAGEGPSDVAGMPDATANAILVRNYAIKNGNLDWEAARGIDISDSEWFPIPTTGQWEQGRKEFWTMGNHVNTALNESTLKSNTIDIDWDAMEMTVAWGARNDDSIVNEFDFLPGLAWTYHMSTNKLDSAYTSVRTGDSVTFYGCGEALDIKKFGLTLIPPTASEARVIPKNQKGGDGNWFTPFEVTDGIAGMDTISEMGYDTRIDTLYKYLEKPEAASWEIVFVDGMERPDLKEGDILKVTAEDGTTTKEYYIDVTVYIPNHNAYLSAITWPDIPEFYKGIFGWMGDTIPQFSQTKYNYNVQVPYDVEGIPALIATPANPDTKIEVKRATSLYGSEAAKTVVFNTTAEDDTTLLQYNVRLEKELDLSNVQPYTPDPFFSQFSFQVDWINNFLEICNPGNQDLDLSKYVIVRGTGNPSEAIATATGIDDWANRFTRYVPGYIWEDEANWQVQPGMLVQDLSVNAIVEPGGAFVIAAATPFYKDIAGRDYPEFDQIDVNFHNDHNPWGIEIANHVMGGWYNSSCWYIYKITNDSVLNNLKPLVDPYDVQIVDVIGNGSEVPGTTGNLIDGAAAVIQNGGLFRYPHIYKGNPVPGASFGDGESGSEWLNTSSTYWALQGYGWPETNSMSSNGLGSHEFYTVTEFISTVSSSSYTVSPGYGLTETIGGGVKEGITIAEFLTSIIYYEAQTLTFMRGDEVLTEDMVLENGDMLQVISENKENETHYTIEVTAEGLDTNALLTSDVYTIEVAGDSGTVSGFELGTTLKEVYSGVTAPSTASLFGAFYQDGSYASFAQMKYDSTYVDVLANDEVYFEVIAQDGETKIVYQLLPNSLASDAYVLSNVYQVDEEIKLISLITNGINVQAFLSNLIPAPGATIMLVNNMGQERTKGSIYEDDVLLVTAQDGVTKAEYALELWDTYADRFEAVLSSDIWNVTQATFRVDGPVPTTTVEEFIEGLTVSMGATFVVLDADGMEITTGLMDDDFTVVVTSENAEAVNIYEVVIDRTGVVEFDNSAIKVYPNPTNGMLNFAGVEEGQVIEVYNAVGRKVLSLQSSGTLINASINDQPKGLYMVIISEDMNRVAQFKLIKK